MRHLLSFSRRRLLRVIAGATLVVVAVSVYSRFANFLPPRTARKLAALHSRLLVPAGRVVSFEETGGESNSDVLTEIILEFGNADFAELTASARKAGFQILADGDRNSATVHLLVPRANNLLYRITGSEERGPYRVVVLDLDGRRLFVRALVRPG